MAHTLTAQFLPNRTRSSSREVRIRVPFPFSVVYFGRGTLPPKKGEKGHYWDLAEFAFWSDAKRGPVGSPIPAVPSTGPSTPPVPVARALPFHISLHKGPWRKTVVCTLSPTPGLTFSDSSHCKDKHDVKAGQNSLCFQPMEGDPVFVPPKRENRDPRNVLFGFPLQPRPKKHPQKEKSPCANERHKIGLRHSFIVGALVLRPGLLAARGPQFGQRKPNEFLALGDGCGSNFNHNGTTGLIHASV